MSHAALPIGRPRWAARALSQVRAHLWQLGALLALLAAVFAVLASRNAMADFVADYGDSNLPPALAGQPPAPPALLGLAGHTAHARRVEPGAELAHAHLSNRVDELTAALSGRYQSIEGDVGVAGGVAVMRHDPRDEIELTFRQWLEVVARADFAVVKVDVKRDLLEPIVRDLEWAIGSLGLDESRLKINASVLRGPGAYEDLSFTEHAYMRIALELEPDDLHLLAQSFPRAAFVIGAHVGPVDAGARYGTDDIDGIVRVAEGARAAGAQRIDFSARWDLLDDRLVQALFAAGVRTDVWVDEKYGYPPDPAVAAATLRDQYGDAIGVMALEADADAADSLPRIGPLEP